MKTNIALITIGVLILSGITYFAYFRKAPATENARKMNTAVTADRQPLTVKPAQKTTSSTESISQVDAITAVKTPKAKVKLTREGVRAKTLARHAKQINARKADLDKDYSELFRRLALSASDIEILKELIIDLEFSNQRAWTDSRFHLDMPTPTPEEVRVVRAEIMQKTKNDAKEFLGDEKFAVFDHYFETLPHRRGCDVITARFAYEAEPLTNETRDQLIDIIYESAKALNARSDMSGADNITRSKFLKEKTLEQAQQVLTPLQLKSIENYYNNSIQALEDENKAILNWFNTKK